MWARVVNLLERVGGDPDDTVQLRLQKRVLVAVSAVVAFIGVIWGALYLAFDQPLAAFIPWIYAVGVGWSLGVFAVTRRYRVFRLVPGRCLMSKSKMSLR